MEYGLQLYSIRDITEENLEDALRQVAEIGYKFVEFAGFFHYTADEVTAMLEKFGLRTSGTHSDWRDLVKNFSETVSYHKKIGNKNFIVPGTDLWSLETMDEFITNANVLQPKLEAEGITFGFHNHSKEFSKMKEGYIPFQELVKQTNINLELDTYWAYAAGEDPVELMEEHKDRIHFIHIKDGDADGKGKPLGMGTAPVAAVYKKACELNIPMVVESETLTPSGIAEAKICFDYLKELENSCSI